MNAFFKKEIRLLLPSFLIGCVLTFSSWLLLWENHDAISGMVSLLPLVVCPAVTVMIALDTFGVEVSSGTFTNLLAQPISRLKIWEVKISLLAVALLVVGVLWFGSIFCVRFFFFNNITDNLKDIHNMFVSAVMFALVVFSGGLWTVLLLRQVAAAFWFTLLMPGIILVILTAFFADHSEQFLTGITVSVLGLYSLGGFFFARWLFLRAQDLQWSGGTIVMPEMRGLPAWLSRSSVQRTLRPRAALWRKEFQLHQSQFIMAFALLLLHLGVIATRNFYDLTRSPDLKFVLEVFWGLWLFMPLLVGCAVVAEERKLGTLEGQLCLPVKRRTQFTIKFSVALFLSILLGLVMPFLLEGTKILPDIHFHFGSREAGWQNQMSMTQMFLWESFEKFDIFLPLVILTGIVTAFGLVSFYVSSLTRNTLQTLAPAVLGILLAFFGLVMIWQMQDFGLDFLWRGPLPYFIVVPVMVLALLALAFAVTATSAIYHRAWEKLALFEPPHGAARLSQSNPVSLKTDWNDISVHLPDGRIWMTHFMFGSAALNPLALMLGNIKVVVDEGKFISGSNWLTLQHSYRDLIGIKADGSLWVSEKPWQSQLQSGKWKIDQDGMQNLVQFGNETNWSSVAPIGMSALLVKSDGTLWRWGVTNWSWKKEWPGLRTFTPYQLGTESDWAEVFQNNQNNYLRKTDGSFWTQSANWDWNTNNQILLQIESGFTVRNVQNPGCDKFRSVAQVSHGLQSKVGVRDDGSFRIWAGQKVVFTKNVGNHIWFPTDLRIGDGTNWVAVAGEGETLVTLKDDGTLWRWDFHHDDRRGWDTGRDEREILDVKPVRLGTHTDWIAISGGYGNVNALAADGSLWFWPLERSDYYSGYDNDNDSHIEPLLDISHKPQLLGNVFGKAN